MVWGRIMFGIFGVLSGRYWSWEFLGWWNWDCDDSGRWECGSCVFFLIWFFWFGDLGLGVELI